MLEIEFRWERNSSILRYFAVVLCYSIGKGCFSQVADFICLNIIVLRNMFVLVSVVLKKYGRSNVFNRSTNLEMKF